MSAATGGTSIGSVVFAAVAVGPASQAGNARTTSGPVVRMSESSESFAAPRAVRKFPGGDVVTAISGAYRSGELTSSDRAALCRMRGDIVALRLRRSAETSRLRVSTNWTGAVLGLPA